MGTLPKSRQAYWKPKIARDKERDAMAIERLIADGWTVLTIWQCETRDLLALGGYADFLDSLKIRSTL
jgi:DNA mismatch endonuclease (patch repair protein)